VWKVWLFGHNGGIDKNGLKNLIDQHYPNYLTTDPPKVGANFAEWVDSELFFIFLLKSMEREGSVWNGVQWAINEIVNSEMWYSALNFFLTDGETLWGLCFYKNSQDSDYYTLHCWFPECSWCGAIASSVPEPSSTEWFELENANLIKLWVDGGSVKSQIDTIGAIGGVGGIIIPVDKLSLLTPYIGLASIILIATVATAIYAKHVKRRRETQ
jgi:predicted glutamine amidotransferase